MIVNNFFLKSFSLVKWLFVFLLLFLFSCYFVLRGSLPELDGQKIITLLDHPLTIERDVQGIPTIRAYNRPDTAFALGYVHAQERYFQMDLLRRKAAGELAALLGDKLISSDEKVILHRFRDRAKKILHRLPAAHYRILQAYSDGVNTGIDGLSNDSYEYLLLGQRPEPWLPEDSLLCVFAMYFDLNDELGERKIALAIMHDTLPAQWFAFLTAKGGEWDSTLDDSKLPDSETQLTIPDVNLPEALLSVSQLQNNPEDVLNFDEHEQFLPGSNSMAIAAAITDYDSAMLANDMHLTLRVPNVWYRASWYLEDGRRISGVTLPGVPLIIAGSNEKLAWGFTNSYGDWDNIITLTSNADNTQYLTPDGWQDFTVYNHVIESNTGTKKDYISIETIWGPVIGRNHKSELMVHQWVAYSPAAVNLNLITLEGAKSVAEALLAAPAMGMPPQNIVFADHAGDIAWTIAGPVPVRKNTGQSDEKQATNQVWQNYLPWDQYPVYAKPESHRIWTANNRLFSDEKLTITGFSGGDLGARAQQIGDALRAKEKFQEKDLLAIQLDNRGMFLQRWKQLLANSLERVNGIEQVNALERINSNEQNNSPEPANEIKKIETNNTPEKAALLSMQELLSKDKTLAAQPDSVAYGLVKAFRKQVVNGSIGWIYNALEQQQPSLFKRSSVDKLIEYPVWELVTKRPEHLIPNGYKSWDEFLTACADRAYKEISSSGRTVSAARTWGELHKLDIRHPLSKAIPALGFFLDMHASPLSGDRNMPKVMGSQFAASMRMVVAPGQEKSGIMHMPAGQSSHPLSSYYSRGHDDWLSGRASSFLPGKARWVLELKAIE